MSKKIVREELTGFGSKTGVYKLLCSLVAIWLVFFGALPQAFASPERPYNIAGTLFVNGDPIGADRTDCTVSLEVGGVELVSYTMGEFSVDFYTLVVPMDTDPDVENAAFPGDEAFIFVECQDLERTPIEENPVVIGAFGGTADFPFDINVVGGCQPTDEVCDGLDNDCDGAVDEDLGTLTCGSGACARTVDACVDGQTQECVPGEPAAEVCDNIDNDCDGAVDNGIAEEPTTCGVGECTAAGVLACVDGQFVDSCAPGNPVAEVCDGLDNDCDGAPDNGIAEEPTTCGVGECTATGVLACVGGEFVDNCVAGEPTAEVCDNADNDCNGEVDDGLPTTPTECGVGECAATGELACVSGVPVDSCVAGEPSDEVCDNADNDCNGEVDDGLPTTPTECGVGECAATGELACVSGVPVDSCVAGEPTAEVCDNADNDCNGEVDDGLPTTPTECGVGECAAIGELACVSGVPVDSCVAGEPSDEVCDNADNDCNGEVDDGLPTTPTECGVGECAATGELACVSGVPVDSCVAGEPSDEVCDNADNDCNGEVDDGLPTTPTECGVGECAATGELACVSGVPVDSCVAGEPSDEVCDNADNDCNGEVDDGLPTTPTECGVGECAATGELACVSGVPVDSCVAGEPSDEVCDNADNDCNGEVDDGLPTTPTECGVGECAATGELACVSGVPVDSCVAGEPSDEVCDNADNDCNGEVDDGLPTTPTECGVGECAATGELACVSGVPVDSCVAGEPSDEVCDNADNDCNGEVDDGLPTTPTECGVGECAAIGEITCVEGEFVDTCMPTEPIEEICGDGIDQDCNENDPPLADAGEAQVGVSRFDPVQLDGSGSIDQDGDPITFFWEIIQKPEGSDASLDDPISETPQLMIDEYGMYEVRLEVCDDKGECCEDSVMITTEDNLPPQADAGEDTIVDKDTQVCLDGSQSSDPNDDDLSYSWSFLSMPGGSTAELYYPTTPDRPCFIADEAGDYEVELIVNDGEFDSDPDTVVVNVPEACEDVLGDIDGDCFVCMTDLSQVLAARNTPASGPDDPRDLDGDGIITVLDARKLVLLCELPGCVCE